MATFSFGKNKPLLLCGNNLLKRSFRLRQKDYDDPMIIIVCYLRFIKEIFSATKKEPVFDGMKEFIYDIDVDSKQIRKDYIRHFTGKELNNYIAKSDLISCIDLFNKLGICFVYSVIVIPVFILSVFSKKKVPLSLLFKEVAENAILLKLVSKYSLSECYFFSIYEKDSNLAAYVLMKTGVNVIKIPSEVPFYFFNSSILCNKLIICNAYQYDEIEFYKNTMMFEKTEMWGPERVTDFYAIYKNKNFSIQRKVIAFYSTASWVREREGHIDQGTSMLKNEQLLLAYLKEYITTHKSMSLIIYTHPKERSDKYINEAKQYYNSMLGDIEFKFADFNILSAASFFNTELAVAFNSTLIHERLYFGFKTLILPLDHDGFPVSTSNFRNICAMTKAELFSKMDKALEQSESEFFRSNGIENYIFK